MKKIITIYFLMLTTSILINAFEKTSFSDCLIYNDTLKTKTELLQDTLKTNVADSTKIIAKKLITPIDSNQYFIKNPIGNILKKSDLNKLDYRYTGNFFSYIPFGYVRDFGSAGQPNEIILYGQGFNSSTYLFDGININNRLNNSFDLNLFQSESIGEIEILPLTQGFLFGSNNNPVAVNFIHGDFKLDKPYTRIRIYQAANQEGFIDGIFNSTFSKRLGVFMEVTNHSTDQGFKNSDYGAWLVSTRVRYLLSEKINLLASYRHAKTNTRLNGGVDYNSILSEYDQSQVDEILFSNIQAPVNYINRYQKVSAHDFSFKTIADFIPGSPSSITLYYQSNLTEFRQNDSTYKANLQDGIVSITDNNRYKTLGAQFDQNINTQFADLRAIASYEQNTITSPLLYHEFKQNNYSLAIKTDLKLFSEIIFPSVFGKYLNYENTGYSGVGADIFFKINKDLKIYAGYSEYEKPKNIYDLLNTSDKQKNRIIEFTANYNTESVKIRLGFFNQTSNNSAIPVIVNNVSLNNETSRFAHYFTTKDTHLKGINTKFDLKIWKILLSSNSSFYFSETDIKEIGIPKFTSNGGIYYVDTLFNSNLKLKTGLNYWSVGSRNSLSIDFEKSISSTYVWNISPTTKSAPFIPAETHSPSFQLDFFLAGQIQENAIVYFTFENLLNAQYFIIPYYPMPERSIRFGVAWEFLD